MGSVRESDSDIWQGVDGQSGVIYRDIADFRSIEFNARQRTFEDAAISISVLAT